MTLSPMYLSEFYAAYLRFLDTYYQGDKIARPSKDAIPLLFASLVYHATQGNWGVDLSDFDCAFLMDLKLPVGAKLQLRGINVS